MDALRKKFSSLFNRSMPLGDQPVRVCEEPKTTDVAQLMQLQQQQQQQQQSQAQQSADEADLREIPNVQLQSQPKQLQLHTTEVTLDLNRALHNDHNERIIPPINYKMEFINFIEHNAPQGFAQKLNDMLPYLGLSFISWPTYWLWRSFRWHEKRRSERIALYIQRTFQHAKLMQLAILATGLFMAGSAAQASTKSSLQVHELIPVVILNMGFTSVLEHIKDWTVTHVRTLWWGTTPKSSDHDDGSQPKTEHRSFPNLGEDVHQVLQTPEFEHVLNSVSPFLLASLGAWPGYWLYRGFDYHAHRAHVPLPIYIRQTFYQAKLVQFAIIAAGIISFLQSQHSEHIESIKNKQL